jgi:hypothetical protein
MTQDWKDRVRPVIKLVSPNGDEFEAKWVGDTRTKDGKVAKFNYPGIRGTVAFDQLPESDKYPLTFHFSGPQHDLTSRAFWAACNQRGTWDIVHPVEGFKNVQFESVSDAIEPVRSGNIRVFTVDSFEPIDPVTLKTTTDLRSNIGATLDDFNAQAASQFERVKTNTFSAVAAISSTTEKITTATDKILGPIAATNDSVSRVFEATQRGIQDTLDATIFRPIQLAGQMQQLMQIPGLAIQDVGARLSAYADLIQEMFGINADGNADGYNVALTKELALSGILGAVASVAGDAQNLQNRSEALEFATTLSDQLASVTNHLDEDQEKFETLPIDQQYFSQSDAYTEALSITGLGIQNFLVSAFDLAIEKRFTLDRYKTPVQIAFEEYGAENLDANIDLVISTNQLAGNDIIVLPPGREVVVYV